MNYEIVTLEEKTVAGICARTNNTSPDMGAVIGGLWNHFYNEGVYASIPGKVNEKALGIYTDYAGEEKSDYTVMTACEITKEVQKEEYTIRKIPSGQYAKFVVPVSNEPDAVGEEKALTYGDMVQAVAAAWQEIWQMDLPRAFQYDFEEYQNDSMENTQIHIYVGLKENDLPGNILSKG